MLTFICTHIERVAIRRGANPVRVSNGCPSEEDNEDILVEVLHLLSSEFQVIPLGRAKLYAATSCMQVLRTRRVSTGSLMASTPNKNTATSEAMLNQSK